MINTFPAVQTDLIIKNHLLQTGEGKGDPCQVFPLSSIKLLIYLCAFM